MLTITLLPEITTAKGLYCQSATGSQEEVVGLVAGGEVE
jgi:hypothetical protein